MSAPPAKPELPSEEKGIQESLAKLGDKAKIDFARYGRIKVSSTKENMREVAMYIRDDLHFDHCINVTGTDFPKTKQIEVSYQFSSIDGPGLRRIVLFLACRVPSDAASVPSLIDLYPSVNLHERELWEMLGCKFEGHPNLTRLLLPEDWNDIPPMLKAYRLPGRLEGE